MKPGRYRPAFSNNLFVVNPDGTGFLVYLDGQTKHFDVAGVEARASLLAPLSFCNRHHRDELGSSCDQILKEA